MMDGKATSVCIISEVIDFERDLGKFQESIYLLINCSCFHSNYVYSRTNKKKICRYILSKTMNNISNIRVYCLPKKKNYV